MDRPPRGDGSCRPFPNTTFTGRFRMCNGSCKGNSKCTYPHNEVELQRWNNERQLRRKPDHQPTPLAKPNVSIQILSNTITHDNYKDKFQVLLYHENQAHINILSEKCNGQYSITLLRAKAKKPNWLKHQLNEAWYKRVGYIAMDNDRVGYAVQATAHFGAVSLLYKEGMISADILPENYSHHSDRLYIAFNAMNSIALESITCPFPVTANDCSFVAFVDFVLKHSYFRNLSDSVKKLSPGMIAKIVPNHESFAVNSSSAAASSIDAFKNDCSEDQFEALKVIASCPPSGPPVIIAGPFGTGKSYVLAVAARYFFYESKKRKNTARILVCTQQRVSADSFASVYIKMSMGKGAEKVCIIQSYGRHNPSLEKEKLYWTLSDFRTYMERSSNSAQRDMIVITTCLTARSLAWFIPTGYFTHILIDEGAQMREPEAVAPLSMAHPLHTKIVIAGDEKQVGPSMLVLGDIPAKYGLSVSLLERLHRHYQRFGAIASSFHGSLVTNYRSRSEILSFTGKLFYDLELRISSNQEPSLHPGYRFPLVFVCTDVEDATIEVKENVNQREVVTTVRTLSEIIRSWPNKLWGVLAPSSLCIMSPSRAQLALLNEHIDKKKMPKLKQVKRLPTFDIQGREFRALLLSTSEPIDSHGSTKNPLKSFSNPYVFNTAITRAQSLVIAFGNPFQLLKMEDQLIDHDRAKGKRCWSTFINLCLREGTVVIDALQTSKKQDVLKRLETWVKLRLPEGDDLIPTSPDSVVSQPMPSPPPQLATSVEISPIPPNVQQGTLGRTKLNEKYNKKEISKPQFANEPKLGGGFTCTVRCRDNKTNKEYEIKGSGTSKAGSKEVAARALLDALGAAVSSVQSASAIPVNTSRSAAINSKTKQPLAVLKELCDKRRFKYEVSTEKNSIPGATNIGFVAKISITDKMSSQIKIQSTSDSKATKKEAAHDSAAKAIELLKLLNTGTLEILEPDDGEFVFTREEKEQVPAQRVAEADPNSTLENMGYDHVKKVASGGFGVVHLVKSTTDGQTYALKIVKLPYLQREQDKCMEEVKVLATLKHANILGYNYSRKVKAPNDWKTDDIWKSLQYVNALSSEATSSINAQSETSSCGVEFERDINVATSGYDPPMCLCIFTEYCEKGTLEKWLYATTERSERSSKIVQFFDQLLQALRYLHGDNAKKSMYIHRDLKPSNIFITQDGENTCLKVGDFGLVKHWPGDLPSVDLSNSAAGDESQSVSRGGTRLYMSPEQLAGNHFDEKVDMYALGLILFELLYPMRTEREKSEVFKKLRAGMIPGRGLVKEAPDMSQLPVVARVIIKGLIKQDPTMRLSAKSLLESGEYQKFKQKMKKKS